MSNSTTQSVTDIDIPIMLFDGGSIGNPPRTAASAILLMPSGRRYTISHFIFQATDMEAQYTGLVIGLRKAKQLGIKVIEVKGCSPWIVNYEDNKQQIQNHEILRLLYRETELLIQSFEKISLEWIPVEQNRSAMTAINRCVGESLSIESKQPSKTGEARKISSAILNFKRLGKEASLEDYEMLKSEIDDLTFKPLAQLETLVPHNIQNTLNSQWKGNTLDLSEAYRWYLRGLPVDMALRKAFLDAEIAAQRIGQKGMKDLLSPPTINIETTLYEIPIAEKELPVIELVQGSEGDTKTYFSPGYINFDETGVNDKETYVCDIDLEWALENTDEKITFNVAPDSFNPPHKVAGLLKEQAKDLPVVEPVKNYRKDPVKDILDSISRLNREEKTYLSQELLNSAELVNLILKAIAEKLT